MRKTLAALGAAAIGTVALLAVSFQPQTRLGFAAGDQWEPSIAADGYGNVYVLYMQFGGWPGCPNPNCPSPVMVLTISRDGGGTWSAPQPIVPASAGQWDPQIVVDRSDHRTVYASWLQNSKSVTVVAKSIDFGSTWTTVVANQTNAATDKDVLVVSGPDVYVAYSHSQTVWVSSSHDSGRTFQSAKVNTNAQLGVSLAGGGAIDDVGNVYFSWAGFKKQSGQAKGPVNVFVTRSADGGASWTSTLLDVSSAPPNCADYSCGWGYLAPSSSMTSDASGQVYVAWNAGMVDQGPERIWFSTSSDRGATWSDKSQVSLAPNGVTHAFPALAAGAAGDVRIAWMDQRNSPHWNVYYRTSADAGATWSGETTLSTEVPGLSYIFTDGFRFPFGDYFGISIDGFGRTHACWGEGYDYASPGSIWYTRQN